MNEQIRVLFIEDDDEDAELERIELERAGFELEWQRVDNEKDLRRQLASGPWDVILSDFRMPDFDGLRAFSVVQQLTADAPFIFVSGALGEERAVEAMRVGARDYLLKGNLARLGVAVRRELVASRTKKSERRLEADARREERRRGMAVEATGAGIFEFDMEHDVEYVGPRLLELLGQREEDVPTGWGLLKWFEPLIHPEDCSRTMGEIRAFLVGNEARLSVECRVRHPERNWIDIAVFVKAVSRNEDGRARHLVGVVVDLTETRTLEEQLRQAQKMEAVGRLAGGVAHDFNNILTAIFSFSRFAMEHIEPGTGPYRDLEEVQRAAKRAQTLTAQLLTFSRRKAMVPRVVDVNEIIGDLQRMLGRVVGEDVVLEARLSQNLPRTRIDPGSLEQVIMNLSVNARDAMPHGGRLVIETSLVALARDSRERPPDAASGNYVVIRVADSGIGMDERTMRQIFEPFFTTKDVGSGTGLGLSTCHGIIKHAGGFISVDSQLDVGTSFRVFLPVTSDESDVQERDALPKSVQGNETILVVEDEEQLRRLTVRALSELGYQVVEAKNGAQALSIFEHVSGGLDLLLTDVVMPEVGGRLLAERLKNANPNLKILFMSGYAPDMVSSLDDPESGVLLLEKPFTPETLGVAVRRVLDA